MLLLYVRTYWEAATVGWRGSDSKVLCNSCCCLLPITVEHLTIISINVPELDVSFQDDVEGSNADEK